MITTAKSECISGVHGRLTLCAYDRKGELLWRDQGENMIVESGYQCVVQALAGVTHINKVCFGTSDKATESRDTELTNPVYIDIERHEYVPERTIRFHFTVGYDDCNGMLIREFGLFSNEGTLFPRRVRADIIEKSSRFLIQGFWDIMIMPDLYPGDYSYDYGEDYKTTREWILSLLEVSDGEVIFDAARNCIE